MLFRYFHFIKKPLEKEWKILYNTYTIFHGGDSVKNDFIKIDFDHIFSVDKIITIFRMNFDRDFVCEGETHDFWEMVYVDSGEVLCTAGKRRFTMRAGEVTFHKPNEYHTFSGTGKTDAIVSVISFECASGEMAYFDGKIVCLDHEEKVFFNTLMTEGLLAFEMEVPNNPLIQRLNKRHDAPLGSSQALKNLLEVFLIRLRRNQEIVPKNERYSYKIGGVEVSREVKEILDILKEHLHTRLTVADVAAHTFKSVSTVNNIFSTYQKGGIIRHFNFLKIEEAKRLIRETELTFTQIAEALSFDTPQYFSRCFRTFAGQSPQEYKRALKHYTPPVSNQTPIGALSPSSEETEKSP